MSNEPTLQAAQGLIDQVMDQVGGADLLTAQPYAESAWIEVIQKMDEVYTDLVRHQLELESKNAELEEAHQYIHSVQSSMSDVLIVCDMNGVIEEINQALLDVTGKRPDQIIGQAIDVFFIEHTEGMLARAIRSDQSDTMSDCELYILDREDGETPLAVNGSRRFDRDGNVVGTVLIGRPVGELRRAYDELNHAHAELIRMQQQLVHSEKMASLGRLVAGVAHELNNPISFVYGNMHALMRYGDKIKKYISSLEHAVGDQHVQVIKEPQNIDRILDDVNAVVRDSLAGAERIRDIVKDLKCYSGTQKEAYTEFEIAEVTKTAAEWVVKTVRREPEMNFTVAQDAENLVVNARKGHVHQIIVNLVQNAVDVMENQPLSRIDMHCFKRDNMAVIEVRDHGPGIEDKHILSVFDPFFTTKPVGKGTGLGLYVSYDLAADQGGQLSVHNHPDGGAVFSLQLPLQGVTP